MARMRRGALSLSHYRLSTFNAGEIYPVMCTEVLPGDTFRHDVSVLLRCTPLLAPVMHPVHVQVHSWFVPTRLLWSNWETYIVDNDTVLTVPTVQIDSGSTTAFKRLAEALGIGLDATPTTQLVNALPFRAYNQIWNEFYRDQDIDTAVTESIGNSDDDANYALLLARWEKDYFTTARATQQKGADVTVNVTVPGGAGWFEELGATAGVVTVDRTTGAADSALHVDQAGTADANILPIANSQTGTFRVMDFRNQLGLLRLKEARNRFGSRYRDYLAFLGVNTSDARLQRPEYLGGGKQTIAFSEVLSTAETSEAALGALGGHGISALRTRPYRRFFEEHGYVLSFIIVRPRSLYMNRIPRTFLRTNPGTYWHREYEIAGDQPLFQKELYYPGDSTVFGYQPRYDEYRRELSHITGEFRTTLNTWHFGRNFSSAPALNSTFLACVPPETPFVSSSVDNFQAMISHRLKARRLVAQTPHRSNLT